MNEDTYGARLQIARKRAGYKTQQQLADIVGVSGKTIRNYETGKTAPDVAMRDKLRRLLGNFDAEGDQVEAAIRNSELVEWRQDTVVGFYKRNLAEQQEEKGATA